MTTTGGGRAYRNAGNSSSFNDSMAPTTVASSRHSDALFVAGSSPFLGSGSSMVSFEDVNGSLRRNSSRSFFTAYEEDNGDEDYEEYQQLKIR